MRKVLLPLILIIILLLTSCSYELTNEQKDEIILDLYKKGDLEVTKLKVAELYKDDMAKATSWILTFKEEENEKYKYQLIIQDGWTWDDEGDYTYIRGRVKNVSDRNIEYFEVTAEYLDANSNVIDSNYTNSGELLKVGNAKEFEIMHKDNPQYNRVQIFVNKVSVE